MAPGLRYDFLLVELGQGSITLVLSDGKKLREMIRVRAFPRGNPPNWVKCLGKIIERGCLTLTELYDLKLGDNYSLRKIAQFLDEMNAKHQTAFGLGYYVLPIRELLEIKTTYYVVLINNACPEAS